MNISSLSIKRPVTTLMAVIAVVLLGMVSFGRLNLDLMPSMEFPYALTYVTYNGAGPEEIENLITKPLEATLGTTSNLKMIQSQSSNGTSMVFLEFNDGTDINDATLQMREKIDMIKGMLPDEASTPMVLQMSMDMMPVLMYSISGGEKYDIVELNHLVEDRIQNRVERISGVASVSVAGGRDKEIAINIKPEKMKGYGITVQAITQLLSAENLNLPIGTIKQGDMDLTVRTIGEFTSIDEIRELPLTTAAGAMIRLSDVADVEEIFEDETSYSYVNGEQAISLSIAKQSTANTVNVARGVNAEIEKIRQEMPELSIISTMDQSVFIQQTVDNVASSALNGALLAVIILYIFLRNVRSTLIVGTSIPISIVATFMLMYFGGITINMMSLGGLTLGVGMLVDNSIVVLENIYRHREMGKNRKQAAADGAREVAMAVVASTLTTVAVFLPIVFVTGIAAKLFKELALTVSFSLLASLVVSLTWVPMLSSKILKIEQYDPSKEKWITTRIFVAWAKVLKKIDDLYRRVLVFATRRKAIVVIVTVVFFIGTLALVPTLGMEFFGGMDEGQITLNITMPKGTLLEETSAATDKVLAKIEDIPEVQDVFVTVGSGGGVMSMGGGSDSSSITLKLVPILERKRSVEEIGEDLRLRTKDIPGTEISVSASSSMSMGGSGIDLVVYGDDAARLEEIVEDMKAIVETVDGTREVTTSMEVGSPEAAIKINRQKASLYGISAAQVASALNTAVSGTTATQFKVDGSEIDVVVRQDPTNINYITDIENLTVQTAAGAAIPLYEISDITTENAPTTLMRQDQSRLVTLSASIYGRDMNSVATDVEAKLSNYKFPAGYYYEFSGTQEEMVSSFTSLGMALVLSIVLVFMVMAAQFESLLYPFIVLMSIPIALTGGLVGLLVLGLPLSVVGFIGLIMLAGIVVNNAIVLVDYINQLREGGMELIEAVITAGPTRLRPILMTTLTTVLGLMPMMLAVGDGAEMQQPIAAVVVFGLTISTLVTLVFIPVLYILLTRLKEGIRKRLPGGKKQKSVPTPAVAVAGESALNGIVDDVTEPIEAEWYEEAAADGEWMDASESAMNVRKKILDEETKAADSDTKVYDIFDEIPEARRDSDISTDAAETVEIPEQATPTPEGKRKKNRKKGK